MIVFESEEKNNKYSTSTELCKLSIWRDVMK